MTVDPVARPVMIAATAAVVPRMRMTIARAAAQRTRPPRRRAEAAPLATTGAETAQATSFSWSGSVLDVRPAGVIGAVGATGVQAGLPVGSALTGSHAGVIGGTAGGGAAGAGGVTGVLVV